MSETIYTGFAHLSQGDLSEILVSIAPSRKAISRFCARTDSNFLHRAYDSTSWKRFNDYLIQNGAEPITETIVPGMLIASMIEEAVDEEFGFLERDASLAEIDLAFSKPLLLGERLEGSLELVSEEEFYAFGKSSLGVKDEAGKIDPRVKVRKLSYTDVLPVYTGTLDAAIPVPQGEYSLNEDYALDFLDSVVGEGEARHLIGWMPRMFWASSTVSDSLIQLQERGHPGSIAMYGGFGITFYDPVNQTRLGSHLKVYEVPSTKKVRLGRPRQKELVVVNESLEGETLEEKAILKFKTIVQLIE